MEVKINESNFKEEVLNSTKPVLVDFWATWCGPCRMLSPIIEEIAAEKSETLKVGKVNVDEEPALATQFGITSIPMLVLFKNGKVVKQLKTCIMIAKQRTILIVSQKKKF